MQTNIPPSIPPHIVPKRRRFLAKRRNTRFSPLVLLGVAVTLLMLLGAGTYFVILPRLRSHAAANTLLPGEQVWKGGTSSLLFGSNDPTFNPATSQSLRLSLRQAGITLIRTPLANNGGTEVDQRLTQIQDIGATCLGILSMQNMALDQQIVKTAGGRCQLYEFGNEPDNPGNPNAMTASAYANSWNQIIPSLRQIAPQAKFFGPAVAYPDTAYISTFLQATQANTPDGVTFHMYPCTDVDVQTCLSQSVNSYASSAQKVRNTVIQVLGTALPIGVTEWNDNWKDQARPEESDPNFMSQFTTLSLQSLMQGQVAFANQYSIGDGQGNNTPGGHLFLTVNGQGTSQLQAMADMIAQTKINSSTPPVATVTTIPVSTPVPTTTTISTPVSTATTISTPVSTATRPPIITPVPITTGPNCLVNGRSIQGCTGSITVNGQACTLAFKNNTVVILCPQKRK